MTTPHAAEPPKDSLTKAREIVLNSDEHYVEDFIVIVATAIETAKQKGREEMALIACELIRDDAAASKFQDFAHYRSWLTLEIALRRAPKEPQRGKRCS